MGLILEIEKNPGIIVQVKKGGVIKLFSHLSLWNIKWYSTVCFNYYSYSGVVRECIPFINPIRLYGFIVFVIIVVVSAYKMILVTG